MSALWLSKLRLGTGSRSRRDRPPYNWVRARTSHLFKRTDVAVPVTDGYVDWFTMGVGKEGSEQDSGRHRRRAGCCTRQSEVNRTGRAGGQSSRAVPRWYPRPAWGDLSACQRNEPRPTKPSESPISSTTRHSADHHRIRGKNHAKTSGKLPCGAWKRLRKNGRLCARHQNHRKRSIH